MKKTTEEIITIINSIEDSTYTCLDEVEDDDYSKYGLGVIKIVEENGGYEGGGDDATRVFHFVDHEVFLRINGSYSSYEGTEWDDNFEIVEPKEVLVTQYHTIKK